LPVDPLPTAAPEQGNPAAPAQTPAAPAAPAETPAATTPSTVAETPATTPDTPRDPGIATDTARGAPTSSGSAPAATPTAESPASGSLAVAPATAATIAAPGQPNTQEPGGEAVAVPDERSAAQRRRAAALARTLGLTDPGALGSPQATGTLGSSPLTQTGGAIPTSAIAAPLVTQATEAITRVRPGGRTQTSGPLSGGAGASVPPLDGVASSGASDSSVGEVLVSWAKYALAILGLLVLALGINAIVAAGRTRRLERQRERLMEDIGLLQAALLPAVPSRLGALLTTVAYRPADGPAAGGDFYDAFALPDGRVGLLLGDVSGHGRQALAKTTLVRFTVRAHLEAGLSPREALAIAGRSLDGRLSDDFATVIAAIHDPSKGTLTYASAGHPPPIVVGPARHRAVTVSSSPPIGVGFPTGQRQTVLPMPEGTSVMIYSDGLLEARVGGVPLGPERLAEWLEELGPDANAKAVLDRVVALADRVPDDLAAVLLHASPGATAPAARIEQLKLDVLDMDGPDLEGFLEAAGVSEVDRLIAGRRVSELLSTTSGVIVEVRTGEHPMVSVAPIGDDTGVSTRPSARVR
jgi:serine phosphatase RsbU (regulator of sigma subunit)